MSDSACQNYENAFARRRCNEVLSPSNLVYSTVFAGNGQSRRVRDYHARLKIQPQVPARRYVRSANGQRAVSYIIPPDSASFHLILETVLPRKIRYKLFTKQSAISARLYKIRVCTALSPITVKRDVLISSFPRLPPVEFYENLQNVTFI